MCDHLLTPGLSVIDSSFDTYMCSFPAGIHHDGCSSVHAADRPLQEGPEMGGKNQTTSHQGGIIATVCA